MSEQVLNRLGYYRIASTTSATEAVCLARCVPTPFDVLIVDHDIIQPSGLHLIERCHQQGLAAHFILSGNPPQALRIRAKELCPALLGSLSAPTLIRPLLSQIDKTLASYNVESSRPLFDMSY
ncbi:hypothetical protein ACTJKT_01055 [Pseudomonas sp. 22526]|uniref:hypothetical protein n=1 Tax=Pseudomonas sp. 22526 TaxID=3453937 RepID=UPI003F82BF86